MSELSKGQLHVRTLARRKAALPQVLVLQPRNTRTHTAHTQRDQFAGVVVGGEGKKALRARESESGGAHRRDDSGQLRCGVCARAAFFACMNLLTSTAVYNQSQGQRIAAFPI